MKKCIFLGCGYLGYNLSEKLKSDFDVRILGLTGPYSELSSNFQEVDVFNEQQLQPIDFENAVVIDTLSLAANNVKADDEAAFIQPIYEKYHQLLQTLKEKKVARYYFISSGGTVYGPNEQPVQETHPLSPSTLYAKIKVLQEEWVRDCAIPYVILRLANPYGGYQLVNKRQGVIPVLIETGLKNKVFECWGKGSIRDYVYLDDVAKMMAGLIHADIQNEIVNIGSGEGHSLETVIQLVEQHLGKKLEIKNVASDVDIVSINVLDTAKVKQLSHVECEVTLEEGIKKEIQRIKEEIK